MNAHDMGAVTVNECLVGECDSKNSIFPSCFPCMFRYGIPKEKKKRSRRAYSPIYTISALGTAGIIC